MANCFRRDLLLIKKVSDDITLLKSIENYSPINKDSIQDISYPIIIFPYSLHHSFDSVNEIVSDIISAAEAKYGLINLQFNASKPNLIDIDKGEYYTTTGLNWVNICKGLYIFTIGSLILSIFIWCVFAIYRATLSFFNIAFSHSDGYYFINCGIVGFAIGLIILIISAIKINNWRTIVKFKCYSSQKRNELLQQKLDEYEKYEEYLQHKYNIIYNNLNEIYQELWKEKIKPAIDYDSSSNPKRGILEDKLLRFFRLRYPLYTKSNVIIESFFPDILLDIEGIAYIDIEIDEPYVLQTGDPIHHIYSKDDIRNEILSNHEIFVIRFAEFQIYNYPNECISIVDAMVQFIKTGNPQCLSAVNNSVPPIKRWSRVQSYIMHMDSLRPTYENCDIRTYRKLYEQCYHPVSLDVLFEKKPVQESKIFGSLKQISYLIPSDDIAEDSDLRLIRITVLLDNNEIRYGVCYQTQFYQIENNMQQLPYPFHDELPIELIVYTDNIGCTRILKVYYYIDAYLWKISKAVHEGRLKFDMK